ncbi:MAG: hypothetical protein ACRDZ4_11190 [Egibacteraceae bacterium]
MRKVTELEIRRLALGLDRPEMAVQLELCCAEGGGINARTLRRWEARTNRPFRLFRRALCKCFEVGSVALLGLGGTFEAARWWTWMTPEEWTEEVDRRQMLGLTAGGTVVLLLPVSELTAAAQFLEGRRRIGAGDLATATRVATDVASAYADTPNAEVRHAARAHVYTLLDLLQHAQMSDDTRTRFEAVASDAACLAGYGEMNAGRLAEADAWFADALRLARQAGDRRLEALALVGCAWIPSYESYPDRAKVVEALEAAAAFHSFLPPAARAYVFGSLSIERAELGDDLVSGRFLEHARAAAALIPHDGPGWGWWSTRGELGGWDAGPRPKVYTGFRHLGLGRPAEALILFDDALDGTTLPVRRSHLHKFVMDACVALDDPDRACASGIAALDEAKTHELRVINGLIRRARRTFPKPWRLLRSVIELDERLALAR